MKKSDVNVCFFFDVRGGPCIVTFYITAFKYMTDEYRLCEINLTSL
jgi:hypothetical protein